jgi:PPOX class probable F420-dependent enzyme
VPKPPLPPELDEFLRAPNPSVIATVRPDGDLHTAATWYEWPGDGTVLVNMDATRLRLGHMRANPRVALTVLDKDVWYNHVSLIGRVREIRKDEDLADIDRIAEHYTGQRYPDRERESWTAVIEVTRWHAWRSGVDVKKS